MGNSSHCNFTGMEEAGRVMHSVVATLSKLWSRATTAPKDTLHEITLDTWLVRAPHVVGTRVGDAWVLDDRRAGEYYTLPATAGHAWELLGNDVMGAGTTVADIVKRILAEYDLPEGVSPAQVERDVIAILRHLLGLRIIRMMGVASPAVITTPPRTAQPHW